MVLLAIKKLHIQTYDRDLSTVIAHMNKGFYDAFNSPVFSGVSTFNGPVVFNAGFTYMGDITKLNLVNVENFTIGDDVTDILTINALITGIFNPRTDNAIDLGENITPLRWKTGYFATSVFSPLLQSATAISLSPAVNTPIIIDTTGTRPLADVSLRGAIFLERGGAGVADLLYMCMKNDLDEYNWIQIAVG